VVLETILRRSVLESASARAEHPTRRNVTLSPRKGTRVRSHGRVGAPTRVIRDADGLSAEPAGVSS